MEYINGKCEFICLFYYASLLLAGEMGLFIVAHLVGIPGHYSTRVFLCYTTNEKDGWLHCLREGCRSLHLRVDLQT